MSRFRSECRLSIGDRSDSSASTSPVRDVDDYDYDSFMMQPNDSASSLAPSTSDADSVRQHEEMDDIYQKSPVSRLPAELLIGIFSKLSSPADLRNCMLVCKEWARNSVYLLWHRPQTAKWPNFHIVAQSVLKVNSYFDYASLIKRLNLAALGNEVSDGTLFPFKSCKRIERLTLTNCTKLTNYVLSDMLQGNNSLMALDLTGLDSISDSTMCVVAKNCTRIQGLNITNCRKISDESMIAVANNCRFLKRLKFNGCSQLTDRSITAFAMNCPQVLEIDLQNCINLENACVAALMTRCHQLRELRLAHCVRINDNAFLTLPQNATFDSLRILDLTDCHELQDPGVQKIISAAPRLRNLVLAKCKRITDRAVMAISRLGKNLHYIHLGHCDQITDIGVLQLVRLCNRIRYIDLACCENLTDNSVQELATLPKLKRIGLVKCHRITDRSILALSIPKPTGQAGQTNPSSLERVHLSYCTLLTLAGIHSLLNNCPRLTHLSLTGIQAFLRQELSTFCREAPLEFTDRQRELFCVYSGVGVARLRTYLNNDIELLQLQYDTDRTMYYDGDGEMGIDVEPQGGEVGELVEMSGVEDVTVSENATMGLDDEQIEGPTGESAMVGNGVTIEPVAGERVEDEGTWDEPNTEMDNVERQGESSGQLVVQEMQSGAGTPSS